MSKSTISTFELPQRDMIVHHVCSSSPDRWKERSRTYEDIAKAMAEQWGSA